MSATRSAEGSPSGRRARGRPDERSGRRSDRRPRAVAVAGLLLVALLGLGLALGAHDLPTTAPASGAAHITHGTGKPGKHPTRNAALGAIAPDVSPGGGAQLDAVVTGAAHRDAPADVDRAAGSATSAPPSITVAQATSRGPPAGSPA